jgi:hypothetical protein
LPFASRRGSIPPTAESEHSLKALVPLLQYDRRDIEIVPVLVPFMPWQDVARIGNELASAVASVVAPHGWVLGKDIAIVVAVVLSVARIEPAPLRHPRGGGSGASPA